jgi:hypothetical protein
VVGNIIVVDLVDMYLSMSAMNCILHWESWRFLDTIYDFNLIPHVQLSPPLLSPCMIFSKLYESCKVELRPSSVALYLSARQKQ